MSKKPREKELFQQLASDFHNLVTNKELLRTSTEKLLTSLVDEFTLGIIFDVHRKYKTNAYDLNGEEDGYELQKAPDITALSNYPTKKIKKNCICPECKLSFGTIRFSTHLGKCMGIIEGRNSTRTTATSNRERDSSFSDATSDDGAATASDDDECWTNSNKKRKKKKERNDRKKRGTPKKMLEDQSIIIDNLKNVDVESNGSDDLPNFRDFYLDNHHSNSSSPTDSVGSSHSTSSRRSRSRKRKDRSSPCSSVSSLD